MNSENNPNQTAIIFISGAGLDASIWDAVQAKVALPSTVLTHERGDSVTLASVVEEALDQIQKVHAERYVIVAHSLGGVIGVELARKLQDKLSGFVAVSATIPEPGKSFVNTLPFPQKFVMPIILKLAGTKPPASAIRKGLCNDLTDEQATAIVNSFTAEPRSLYVDETSLEQLPTSKYLYIRTLEDKELPVELQNKMVQQLPAASITDVAAGHLAMVSRADEIAEIINSFVADL
jgi:pimeloyl-ACP methyl ester carboxylesterase